MRSIRCALALMSLGIFANAVISAEPEAERAQTSAMMSKILASEATGEAVDRRAAMVLPASAKAADHWQVGELLVRDKWISLDALADLEKSQDVKEYLAMRSAATLNEPGHRQLARWCRLHRLNDQARAHWHAVLATRPNDVEARRAIGHQLVNGYWFSPEELKEADDASRRVEAEWRKWMPTMRKLVADLTSSNTSAKQRALARLTALDDPTALSSLEITACQLDADQAIPFLQAIDKLRSTDACIALARIAVTLPTDRRGAFATNALRAYPQECYVPELLGLLSTPIESAMETAFNSKGELLIRRAMFREVKDEKQLLRLNRLVRTSEFSGNVAQITVNFSVASAFLNVGTSISRGGKRSSDLYAPPLESQIDEIAGAKNAAEDQRQLENQIAAANVDLARAATPVYTVLEGATQVVVERTPQAWWDWWQKYNERTTLGKSTRNYDVSRIDGARAYLTAGRSKIIQMSCLVAGTLVHTAEGPKPIQSVLVGDMVVSQDVETGELALRPVLQTTVRPPKTTLTIVTQAGKIQATAGHRWFVAGKGWLMTRELEPGMLLHTATGTTSVNEVSEDSHAQETYNLVVDGFHTYFVGPQRILSFDNSEPRPTLRAVPGFGKLAKH